MSGMMVALVGTGQSGVYNVTVGKLVSGSYTFYGFISGSTGSVSPTSIAGYSINSIEYSTINTLIFSISGTVTQTGLFANLTVGGNTYAASAATFGSSGGITTWTWYTTTNPFPTVGAVVPVTII